jgi:hypothetical protein
MDQRDWELLDKQMRELSPSQNHGITVLTIIAVFLVGMVLGGIVFANRSEPMHIASNDAPIGGN